MRAKRAFVLAASAVLLVATGTAVAVTNFGLLHANDRPSPAGSLDLRTVQQDAGADVATAADATRVDLRDGIIHVIRPDGSEVTVPLPPADTAAAPSHDGDGDDSTSSTTRAGAPSHDGRHDDDD